MKTAVSIPDEIFERAERLRRRSRRTRSDVFTAALREYLARHAADEVSQALDRVCERLEDHTDDFVATAARQVLGRSEW